MIYLVLFFRRYAAEHLILYIYFQNAEMPFYQGVKHVKCSTFQIINNRIRKDRPRCPDRTAILWMTSHVRHNDPSPPSPGEHILVLTSRIYHKVTEDITLVLADIMILFLMRQGTIFKMVISPTLLAGIPCRCAEIEENVLQ